MRPPSSDAADTLSISPGYELRVLWEEPRKTLNQSPVYLSLRQSDGLLSPEFLEISEAIARLSRGIDRSMGLAGLVREVESGKEATPLELFTRALQLLELPDATISDLVREAATAPTDEAKTAEPSEHVDSAGVSAPSAGSSGSAIELTAAAPSPSRLLDLAFKLVNRTLTPDEKRAFFDTLRRGIVESSRQIQLLDGDLRKKVGSEVSFVRHWPLYECECGPLGNDVRGECVLCRKGPVSDPTSIAGIQPDLLHVLDNNTWLELGVARVFDKLGFVTYIGSHPVGLSGASHEVDILAWDPQQRHLILAEVTTEQASMDRMGKVLLRREDIPVHAAALVTLGDETDDVREYGRRHGIGVISSVRDNCGQLQKWIESARARHGNRPKEGHSGSM